MKTNSNKQTTTYSAFVIATNSAYKEEKYSLSGAVKSLCLMENLPKEVAVVLRRYAGGKPFTTASGRNSVKCAVADFAKGQGEDIMRKATKKEREEGAPELVKREKYSVFWVLQQLYKMSK